MEEMYMTKNVGRFATRMYVVLICTAAPMAMVQAQSGAAGGGQGGAATGQGTGTAGTVAGQPGGTGGNAAGVGGTGAAGAGNGSAAGGQSDLGYAQAQDNNNRGGGGSKAGWLGLLGLLGLLGMRRRDTAGSNVGGTTTTSYETTGARR
jgi:MYXO-CTERM domain-containing protein